MERQGSGAAGSTVHSTGQRGVTTAWTGWTGWAIELFQWLVKKSVRSRLERLDAAKWVAGDHRPLAKSATADRRNSSVPDPI